MADLDRCCSGLSSTKVMERRRCADELKDLLNCEDVIKSIISPTWNRRMTWNHVISCINGFLAKEAEKLAEDESKNRSTSRRNVNGDLLVIAVKKAVLDVRFNVSRFLADIIRGLNNNNTYKYFSYTYLIVLLKHVLKNQKYWSQVPSNTWIELWESIKPLYNNPPNNVDKTSVVKAFYSIIKVASTQSALCLHIKNEFMFIQKVCTSIKISHGYALQIAVLQLLHSFCSEVAPDCRMSCCKLGEEVIPSILSLYVKQHEDTKGVKFKIFDNLLLQVQLHHPAGVLQGSDSAFAHSWDTWKQLLVSTYFILCTEIDMISKIKPARLAKLEVLWPNVLNLIVEVFHQLISGGITEISQQSNSDLFATGEQTQASKKRKIDIGVLKIVENAQENNSWTWLCVLSELCKRYPQILTPEYYNRSLEILSSLQVDHADPLFKHHVYKTLQTFVQIQKDFGNRLDAHAVDVLWEKIWDTTLRTVGLNQNEEATHNLLQELLVIKKFPFPTVLFNMYLSGDINITQDSLQTLLTICCLYTIPEKEIITRSFDKRLPRKILLSWVLNSENFKNSNLFKTQTMGEITLTLISKKGCLPKINQSSDYKPTSVENAYLLTSFETEVLLNRSPDEEAAIVHSYTVNPDMLNEFENMLVSICEAVKHESDSPEKIEEVINLIGFISHVEMNVPERSVQKMHTCLCDLFDDYCSLLCIFTDKHKNDKNSSGILLLLKQSKILFSNKLSLEIKDRISVEVISRFFDLLNPIEDDESIDSTDVTDFAESLTCGNTSYGYIFNEKTEICRCALEVICFFCFDPNASTLLDKQKKIIETFFSDMKEDVSDSNFDMLIYFFKAMVKCKVGTFSYDVNVLDLLKALCEKWYTNHTAALEILQIIHDIYPHVAESHSLPLKAQSAALILSFFENRRNYGSRILTALINCMIQLAKVDPSSSWALWSDLRVVCLQVVEFINNDYLEIRLLAVKEVAALFDCINKGFNPDILLQDISFKVEQLFQIEGNFSDDRKVDETANRLATALYTYADIAAGNSAWRKKALVLLVQLIVDKNINTALSIKILTIISQKLKMKNFESFIDYHAEYLITSWCQMGRSITSFPFSLLNCQSDLEFYGRYAKVVIPAELQNGNSDIVLQICQKLNITDGSEEKFYPSLIAHILPIICFENSLPRIRSENGIEVAEKLFREVIKIVPATKIKEILLDKLDEILVGFVRLFLDLEYLGRLFDFHDPISEETQPHFNMLVFKSSMEAIEKKFLRPQSLISYCMAECPSKLERVVLATTADVKRALTTEEKLKCLHRYSVFYDFLASQIIVHQEMSVYLIRQVSFTLLHLIGENRSNYVSVAACKCLKWFYSKCIPHCATILERFLKPVVDVLVPIVQDDGTNLGDECLALLNYLIVENSEYLSGAIKMLDSFPEYDQFYDIQRIYERNIFGNRSFTLIEEIRQFLSTAGSNCKRIEGLRHLKHQLEIKKDELKTLYHDLNALRGFSEDCESSDVHRLVCNLVELSKSSDKQVSLEAAKCLGELGPADLTTMVLQPEKMYDYKENGVLELLTERVIALLSTYLVDSDLEVVQTASEALYKVLDSYEGHSIISDRSQTLDNGCGKIVKAYVIPFVSQRKFRSRSKFTLNENKFEAVNVTELWCPTRHDSHERWITDLVSALLESFSDGIFLSQLIPICKVKPTFGEQLLPLLISLLHGFETFNFDTICLHINSFFEHHWNTTARNIQNKCAVALNKVSIQCMLKVINFIRVQESAMQKRLSETRLRINYLHAAQAAHYCSAHFTVLLFVELWLLHRNDQRDVNDTSLLEYIEETEDSLCKQVWRNVLRQNYKEIGDPDGIVDCGFSDFFDFDSQINMYKHMDKWDKINLFCDIKLSNGNQVYESTMSESLKNSCFYYLSSLFKSKIDYDCAWRLSKWDVDVEENSDEYEKYHYFALKSFHNHDPPDVLENINQARTAVVESLFSISLQSTKNLYRILSRLQCLQELEDISNATNENDLFSVLNKWKNQDELNKNEFVYLEPIRSQRISLLKSVANRFRIDSIQSSCVDMQLSLAELARSESFPQVTTRIIGELMLVPALTFSDKYRMLFEEAQLMWNDEKRLAHQKLKHLLDDRCQGNISAATHSATLKLYADWMAETRSENAKTVIGYYKQALDVLQEMEIELRGCDQAKYEVYDALARFADSEYQRIDKYIHSSIFDNKIKNIERTRQVVAHIRDMGNSASVDELKTKIISEKQSALDQAEVNNTFDERNTFLKISVSNYIKNLLHNDSYDLRIFRIISLWFDNKTHEELACILRTDMPKIPSYKFIPLLPQLIPHISSSSDSTFSTKIGAIIERCAVDHPHHTLPLILSLANSYRDRSFIKSSMKPPVEPRVIQAKFMVDQLKRNRETKLIVQHLETVSLALIDLAYLDADKCQAAGRSNKEFTIPASHPLRKIKNYDDVALMTLPVTVKKNCNYDNIIGIREFKNTFAFVGGINCPKKITCIGTDGLERTQLVKGKDDLRQDAVMQQVFAIMNTLLAADKHTKKLCIRTYKVVPLSQRSGVIEWCENTETLGDYLIKAHRNFHPNDMSPGDCKTKFRDIAKRDIDYKLRVYNQLCLKLRPVFHMFFITTFPQPTLWYERRKAYTLSVATSSMVGYILGIGDRHVVNILIDKTTAEVIHIDFGIAFEQGKILPTPETVPFRLTRDVEAGMGVFGVEGVFRRACEQTMQVLRQNAETIITILEVLLYDPLYAWTLSPKEAFSKQYQGDSQNNVSFENDDASPTVNQSAERALSRLRQKLQGMEEGSASSVEGQVERLLQQARDPLNLCRLYYGWQPYL